MELIKQDGKTADVCYSLDELSIIHGVMSKVYDEIDIWEFQTRLGVYKAEFTDLMADIRQFMKRINEDAINQRLSNEKPPYFEDIDQGSLSVMMQKIYAFKDDNLHLSLLIQDLEMLINELTFVNKDNLWIYWQNLAQGVLNQTTVDESIESLRAIIKSQLKCSVKLLKNDARSAEVRMSLNDILTLHQSMNEVCHSFHVPEFEKIGSFKEKVRHMMDKIGHIINKMEKMA